MYPTLTEYSAADFSTVPGLAESWEESADQTYWTYKIRPGSEVERRQATDRPRRGLHLQPGHQRRHRADQLRRLHVHDHQGRRAGRHHAGPVREEALADHVPPRGLHPPRTHLEGHRRQAGQVLQERARGRTAGRGWRPLRADRATQGRVPAVRGQPRLLRRQARGRRGRLPGLQEHRRDRRGVAQGRGRLRQRPVRERLQFAGRAPRASPRCPACTPGSTRSPSTWVRP